MVVLPFLFQKLAVFLQVGPFLVLVGDANASSQIKVTDLKVVSPQIGRDYLKLQESLHKRFYIQNLRADMEAYLQHDREEARFSFEDILGEELRLDRDEGEEKGRQKA